MNKRIVITVVCILAIVSTVVPQGVAGEEHVLKSVSCDPVCGFMVRSHDEKELSAIVIEHSKTHHNKIITEKEVKEVMKSEHVSVPEKKKK